MISWKCSNPGFFNFRQILNSMTNVWDCIVFALLYLDCSRKLIPLSETIRLKNNTNDDLITRVFPRFRKFGCFSFEFLLDLKSTFLSSDETRSKAFYSVWCYEHYFKFCFFSPPPIFNLKPYPLLSNLQMAVGDSGFWNQ